MWLGNIVFLIINQGFPSVIKNCSRIVSTLSKISYLSVKLVELCIVPLTKDI